MPTIPLFLFFVCIPLFLHTLNFETMTLEEKVGQLLIVHFNGQAPNEDARILIQEIKVGGIIYYQWANGLNSPEQVLNLSFGLQKLVEANNHPFPLFIAVDQEGGIVARLHQGFTVFPGNRALSETCCPELAEEAAFFTGQELKAVGINMNFAPVVDVHSNPRNPVIGIRSFGDDPETVCVFGEKTLKGYQRSHIIASLKHFPGHGDVEIDSHQDLPIVHKSLKELECLDLLPFTKLVPSVDLIMTAHLLVPALDIENCSTLSKKTLSYLKNELGFTGAVITDSLVMQGVLKKCQSVDEAAIQALDAGCDILLLGGRQLSERHSMLELTVKDIQRIHRSLLEAIKKGRISEERLNQAVKKILKLKENYLLSTASKPLSSIHSLVNFSEHQALAQKIASLALKVYSDKAQQQFPLDQKNITVFFPELLRNTVTSTSIAGIGKSLTFLSFGNLNPSHEQIEALKKQILESDALFFFSYSAWKNSSQATLIQELLDMGKPLFLFVIRDPLDASLFPRATLIVNTFSPTAPSIQAVWNLIKSYPFISK